MTQHLTDVTRRKEGLWKHAILKEKGGDDQQHSAKTQNEKTKYVWNKQARMFIATLVVINLIGCVISLYHVRMQIRGLANTGFDLIRLYQMQRPHHLSIILNHSFRQIGTRWSQEIGKIYPWTTMNVCTEYHVKWWADSNCHPKSIMAEIHFPNTFAQDKLSCYLEIKYLEKKKPHHDNKWPQKKRIKIHLYWFLCVFTSVKGPQTYQFSNSQSPLQQIYMWEEWGRD